MNRIQILLLAVCLLAPSISPAAVKADSRVTLTSVSAPPALQYGKDGSLTCPVRLTAVNHTAKNVRTWWSHDGGAHRISVTLVPGENRIDLALPEECAGKQADIILAGHVQTLTLPEAERMTIYLVQHTHTDIGYTKPQTEILSEHLRYIDYALDYCDATASYPDAARFRWTCEAAWAVDEWLKVRPQEQVDRLLRYVQEGRIEVTAMYFNMSEISDEGNYRAFLEPVGRFHRLGIPVTTAMQDDVNGVAWCLADYLPDIGVKYLSMGSNATRSVVPFGFPTVYKWRSPSGKELISYRSDHYMTANFWGIEKGDMDVFAGNLFAYVTALRGHGYPFSEVAVQYSGFYTDNSPPCPGECDLIRDWNERYAWPKLRSATVSDFLKVVEAEHGAELPVWQAAFPDYWTDGFGSAARETAASRRTQADTDLAEGLLSMGCLSGDTAAAGFGAQLRRIREDLLFYDEHTFGAAESISDPHCENSEVQWSEKAAYVWDAVKRVKMLTEAAAGRLQGALYRDTAPTLTLFNTLGTPRSAPCTFFIDNTLIPRGAAFDIVDEQGRTLPVQQGAVRAEGRYFTVWASDVPAMGYRTYTIRLGDGSEHGTVPADLADNTLENRFYRIVFDPHRGGIRSWYDKELGRELVDPAAPWSLGGMVYETMKGNRNQMLSLVFDEFTRQGFDKMELLDAARGELCTTVRFRGTLPGCDPDFGVQIDVKVFSEVKRIELAYRLKRLPETDPAGLYVTFPFDVPDGKLAFDVPGGLLVAGENQIPSTTAAWNTVQHFVTARNDGMQVLVSSDAVPLFMMGELMNDPFRPAHRHEKTHLFSWVMNNYWMTNFRASQEGEFRWDYVLTSGADRREEAAYAFGFGNRIPLYARVLPGAPKANGQPRERSFLGLEGENVLLVSAAPAQDGGVVLHVRETAGRPATLSVKGENGLPLRFARVNVLEESMGPVQSRLEMAPYENVFLRLER